MKTEKLFKIFWIIVISISTITVTYKQSSSNSNTVPSVYKSETKKRTLKIEYCSYCGKEISGKGEKQFGQVYCDLACYADAN
jgi:hypothetical protein